MVASTVLISHHTCTFKRSPFYASTGHHVPRFPVPKKGVHSHRSSSVITITQVQLGTVLFIDCIRCIIRSPARSNFGGSVIQNLAVLRGSEPVAGRFSPRRVRVIRFSARARRASNGRRDISRLIESDKNQDSRVAVCDPFCTSSWHPRTHFFARERWGPRFKITKLVSGGFPFRFPRPFFNASDVARALVGLRTRTHGLGRALALSHGRGVTTRASVIAERDPSFTGNRHPKPPTNT